MAAYGSGHFGRWITDEAGLPAYEYTCNHLQDPAAEYATRHGPSRDHFHLLGNYHASAIAHNEGYVELFRPDTGGAWLNRYAPQRGAFAGGFGFVRLGRQVRSTLYRHLGDPLYQRVWGVGYYRRRASWGNLAIEQVTCSPYGDDPVLLSLTTLHNRGIRPLQLSYVEYWDVTVAPMQAGRSEARRIVEGLRVRRSTRYDARRRLLVCSPVGRFPGHDAPPGSHDPDPPTIFLAAIDGRPVAGYETSRAQFFGEGGLDAPAGLDLPFLPGTTFPQGTHAGGIVLAMQRDVTVAPRSRLTLAHIYGYGAWNSGRLDATGSRTPAGLVERYAIRAGNWLEESLQSWQRRLVRFEAPEAPWLAREAAWNSYYAQAMARLDAYTNEVFFDQGGCRTYEWGLPPNPRASCQHALALLPNNPAQVRGTIRHLIRMTRPDGSQAVGDRGRGRPFAPTRRPPCDLQLWLLWLIADYALFYRDRSFAEMEVPLYPQEAGHTTTIRQQVRRSLDYLRHTVGRGRHGLLRLLAGDGNEAIAAARGFWQRRRLVREGESTLASGLAGVALPRVAQLCRWLGETTWAQEVEEWAADNRQALLEAWNGRWFDRVLLPEGAPLGRDQLFLDAQPWAVLAGAADEAQRAVLFQEIQRRLLDPSPIGPAGLDPLGLDRGLPPGNGMNGGISFATNAPLVWAWALDDPAAAWALLGKCTLAAHAESYPEQWAGIWSGPDGFAAHTAGRPGEPWQYRLPLYEGGGLRSHREFPIASAHSAGALLFTLARLAGIEADAQGLLLRPHLPFDHFAFETARIGVRWEGQRALGYIVPQGNDTVQVRIVYREPFPGRPRVRVDGQTLSAELSGDGHQVHFPVFVRGGMRSEWEVSPE